MDIKKIVLIMLLSVTSFTFAGGPTPIATQEFQMFIPKVSPLALHTNKKSYLSHNKRHAEVRYVEIYTGSLKANVVRLARVYGWKQLIWLPTEDYHWIGSVRFSAQDLPSVLGKILEHYPLQANFYAGNHVLVIKPRTIV